MFQERGVSNMDYIMIIIIVTSVTSFLSGLVLGKLLEMGLMDQLILGLTSLFLTSSVIDVIATFAGYEI